MYVVTIVAEDLAVPAPINCHFNLQRPSILVFIYYNGIRCSAEMNPSSLLSLVEILSLVLGLHQ